MLRLVSCRRISTELRNLYTPEKARELLSKFSGGSVTVTKDDGNGIARIHLEHAGKKNAFSGKMMLDLEAVVNELETWDKGRVAVLEGVGGDFASGADLSFVSEMATKEGGFVMNTFMGSTLLRLHRLPLVTIANAHGFVLGGATEVYSSCDIRTARSEVKVGFVQARMGIAPGWAGAARIAEIVGRSKAIEVLSASLIIGAKEAHDIGFVNYVYEKDEDFEKYLSKFTKNSVNAVRACKQMVNDAVEAATHEDKHAAERDILLTVWGGPDNLAALNSKTKHK